MLIVLIFWDVDIDGTLHQYHRRYIDVTADVSTHRASIIDILKGF
jgi:hypothetical protein